MLGSRESKMLQQKGQGLRAGQHNLFKVWRLVPLSPKMHSGFVYLLLCPWQAHSPKNPGPYCAHAASKATFISAHTEAHCPPHNICPVFVNPVPSQNKFCVPVCAGEGWQGWAGRGHTRSFCSGTPFHRAEEATDNYSKPLGVFFSLVIALA